MKASLYSTVVGLLFIVSFLLAANSTFANDSNKATKVEVSGDLIIPGALTISHKPAFHEGKFVLKLLDSPSTRNIVLVYDANGFRYLGIAMGITTYRNEVTVNAQLVFEQTPDGTSVLRKWFYAGEYTGLEFPYPIRRKLD